MGSPSNPRRHPHLAETIGYLRHCGAEDVEVISRKKAHRISCRIDNLRLDIAIPRATSCPEVQATMARQLVRRRFREAGVEVRA